MGDATAVHPRTPATPLPPHTHNCSLLDLMQTDLWAYHDGEVVGRVEDPTARQDGSWVHGIQGLLDALLGLAEGHAVVVKRQLTVRGDERVGLSCMKVRKSGGVENIVCTFPHIKAGNIFKRFYIFLKRT